MKLISIMIIISLVSACTSLRPIEMPPEQLQERISAGSVISVGDSVRILTKDGENHDFKVTAISDDQISGKNETVAIADIVALESRGYNGWKTAGLVGGALLLALAIAASGTGGRFYSGPVF